MKNFKIDYNNIKENIVYIKNKFGKQIMFVVKDNAYNMGLVNTVVSTKDYVDYYAVSVLSEALLIRSISEDIKILIMNPLTEEELCICKTNCFDVSVTSFEYFQENKNILQDMRLHLKINIGMNRFGIKDENEIFEILNSDIKFIGVFTHFSRSDEENLFFHNEQVNKWIIYYQKYFKSYNFKYIHCENSSSILNYNSKLQFSNMIRIGILGYGYSPIYKINDLNPCLYLKAKVISINNFYDGESIGYSSGYICNEDKRVAIIDIGYGSGILKERIKYPVYIKNKSYNCIQITMSHLFIDIDKDVSIFDEVEIYGKNICFDDVNRALGISCSVQMSSLNIK